LGDLTLQSGQVLPDAKIAYKTHGKLNARRDNVIVFPTAYCGEHTDNEWLIGEDMALNPDEYFIVVPNMFGNGLSSSPSNRHDLAKTGYPLVTPYDNVLAQRRLLEEAFGVEEVALATGFSMGAIQAYHWATMFPGQVRRLMPYCGAAKTASHNWVFLEGVRSVLALADEGAADETAVLKAAGRVYAGWAYSQSFYRNDLWLEFGFETREEFLVGFWDQLFTNKARLDLLAMLATWQSADVSRNDLYHGDVRLALSSIQAKTIVMPASTDLYFTVDDSELEVRQIPDAKLAVLESSWGHAAGVGLNRNDSAVINRVLGDLLSEEVLPRKTTVGLSRTLRGEEAGATRLQGGALV
jgi:homoserine O-acetyltransferase/O-succinyltransferase